MGFHFDADDTQLYLSFNSLGGDNQVNSVAQIESCVRDIDRWMARNKLKLRTAPTIVIAHTFSASHLFIFSSWIT